MVRKRVADVLIDTLVAGGVKRVYGLVGDSLCFCNHLKHLTGCCQPS